MEGDRVVDRDLADCQVVQSHSSEPVRPEGTSSSRTAQLGQRCAWPDS
jgi:hypothetical protein